MMFTLGGHGAIAETYEYLSYVCVREGGLSFKDEVAEAVALEVVSCFRCCRKFYI